MPLFTEACAKGRAAEQERGTARKTAFLHAQQMAAARYAVDPIEAPAPAWVLDTAALESPSSPLPPASTPPSHIAAARSGAGVTQGLSPGVSISHELQNSSSVQADGGWSGNADEQGNTVSVSASAALAQSSISPIQFESPGLHVETAAGNPAGAVWHGFAAHAGTNTADLTESAFKDESSAVGAADSADSRPTDCGPALPEVAQQSSQPGSIAAFSGFDVPEDDVPENHDSPPQAHNSTDAGVIPVGPNKKEEISYAVPTTPVVTDKGVSASQLSLAKRERRPSASHMKPSKVEKRVSGSPVPTKTDRGSRGVLSRGPTGDVPSGKGVAAGVSKVSEAGPMHRAGQLAQGRTVAAPNTSAVSGASCHLEHVVSAWMTHVYD